MIRYGFVSALLLVGCGASKYHSSYGGGGGGGRYSTLAEQPAVRHMETAAAGGSAGEELAFADEEKQTDAGGGGSSAAPPPSQVGQPGQEALVVEGWVRVEVGDVAGMAAKVRLEVLAAKGKVISEQLDGTADGAWNGSMNLRLPPDQVAPFLEWLAKQGDITSRRITASDVSKTLVDDAIALENLELTLKRLQDLVQKEGVNMTEVLAIEQQMERVRGEIERIKGEQRYLQDRVAYATLDVQLARRHDAVLGGPKAKFHPGPRVSALTLASPGARKRTRGGIGVELHFDRAFTMDLDLFPEPKGTTEGTDVLLTAGGAAYSDFLGRGRRSFLNPYLGLRLGYGHVSDKNSFVLAGEIGLELYKQKYVMVETFVRGMGLISDSTEGAFQFGGAVVFAF